MRATRTTVLMSEEERRALDAFAASRGESIGNVVREATARYIGLPTGREEAVRELELVLPEAEAAVAAMNDDIAAMREMIAQTRATIAAVVSKDGASA